jgi:hypothetical protein
MFGIFLFQVQTWYRKVQNSTQVYYKDDRYMYIKQTQISNATKLNFRSS